jgi:hypothetical protein
MPVVALIFSTLLFWVVYWFIRMGGIDHVQERVAQRRDSARRLQTKEASWLAPLRSVNDPRDAAAILMLLIARVHGDPTRDQIATVERFMRTEFGFAHEFPERMTPRTLPGETSSRLRRGGDGVRRPVQALPDAGRMPAANRDTGGGGARS